MHYRHAQCKILITSLPTQEQGFHINKQEFQDALRLRYGQELSRVLSHCVCCASFDADVAMICRHDGLTFICHNELRDLPASWLHEVCRDVAIELPLQPLYGKTVIPASANHRDDLP